jgi:hypothetical protein
MKKLLEQLRARLAKHEQRAAEIQAEIVDGMVDDEVRAIEARHSEVLDEIESVRALIAETETALAEAGATSETNDTDAAAAVRAERSRIAEIRRIGGQAALDEAEVTRAIDQGDDPQAFLQRAFETMASRERETPTRPTRILRDEGDTERAGLTDAMVFRMGGAAPQGDAESRARPFMEPQTLVAMAAQHIGHRGLMETVREREEVLSRAFHTTSDFPNIFGSAINTVLESRYALAQPTYRRIAAVHNFVDFRPHYAVKIGEFPMLAKLTEAGEIQMGTFSEGKEQLAVIPYARGISISRQMMVNDRLGAIGELLGGYGRTVARFEEITFYAMMLSANTKLADTKAVFHADHGNLAGAGAAITTASVGAGRAAIRKQEALDGAKLNFQPSILLVSPDKETEAQQFVTPVVVNDQVKANPMSSLLSIVVAGELTGNAWYLFADPADAPVYKYGFLDGYTAPRIRMDEPFGTQGMAMTVEHDFGVGAIDYRGAYKNPGA